MKTFIFLSLFILFSCVEKEEPTPIGSPTPIVSDNPDVGPPRSPGNSIDPGCHGGEWFENHNLATISPWTYNEWATITLKANVSQAGYGGMGPVRVRYRVKNHSTNFPVRVDWIPIPASGVTWSGTNSAILQPGQSVTRDMTISSCQPVVSGGWYEYQFGLMFSSMGGASQLVGGEIISVTGLNCAVYPYCTEHKKASYEQAFTWTVVQ